MPGAARCGLACHAALQPPRSAPAAHTVSLSRGSELSLMTMATAWTLNLTPCMQLQLTAGHRSEFRAECHDQGRCLNTELYTLHAAAGSLLLTVPGMSRLHRTQAAGSCAVTCTSVWEGMKVRCGGCTARCARSGDESAPSMELPFLRCACPGERSAPSRELRFLRCAALLDAERRVAGLPVGLSATGDMWPRSLRSLMLQSEV